MSLFSKLLNSLGAILQKKEKKRSLNETRLIENARPHLNFKTKADLRQGDQMLSRKNRPKCSPTHFVSKLKCKFFCRKEEK
jgi:hypothetical protein